MSRLGICLGREAEEVAATFFRKRGYDILETNYRTPVGEIDLIVRKGEVIVFVEVKARGSSAFGGPEDAVTPAKQDKIRRTARWYLMEKAPQDIDFRFDVLAFRVRDGRTTINHIVSAFEA